MKIQVKFLCFALFVAVIFSASACSLNNPDNSANTGQTKQAISKTAAVPPSGTDDFVPGKVIVQFKSDATSKSIYTTSSINTLVPAYVLKSTKRLVSDENITSIKTRQLNYGKLSSSQVESTSSALSGLMVLEYDNVTKDQTLDIIKNLKQNPSVQYAEPDYREYAANTPNDPYFGNLWGMTKIQAPQAWDKTTGSSSVIVAVIDTGVDYNHPDLKANMMAGYDFYNNDNNPMDDNGHGTHVSGIIGASGNNGLGVTGINWNIKIMPIKFLGADGSGEDTIAIQCIDYAIAHGAQIINASWGDITYLDTLRQAIARAKDAGVLFVAAAGNYAYNCNSTPFYPASYDVDNIISVASVDSSDNLSYFSDYGPTTVDIAAPGESICSTWPGNSYAYEDGTSMSAPHVAGAAALEKALHPSLSYLELKNVILNNVDKISSLNGKMVSGGRLNVNKMLYEAPVLQSPDNNSQYVIGQSVYFSWKSIEWARSYNLKRNNTTINVLGNSCLLQYTDAANDTWSVQAVASDGTVSEWSEERNFSVNVANPVPNPVTAINTLGSSVNLSWYPSPSAVSYFVTVTGPSVHLSQTFTTAGANNLSFTLPYYGHYSWTVQAHTANANLSDVVSGDDFYCLPQAASAVIFYPFNDKALSMGNPKDLTEKSIIEQNVGTSINSWIGTDPSCKWTSYHFNGTSSYIKLRDCSYLNDANIPTYTIAFWYKSSANNGGAILSKGNSINSFSGKAWDFSTSQGYGPIGYGEWLYGTGYYFTNINASAIPVQTAGEVVISAWHHVIMTFDGVDEKLYIDGVAANPGPSVASKGSFNPYNENQLFIGARETGYSSIGGYFNGDIYNLMIFKTTLIGPDITSLYQDFSY